MFFMPDNPKEHLWGYYHSNLTQQLPSQLPEEELAQQQVYSAVRGIDIVVRTLYGHKVEPQNLNPLLSFFKALSKASHRIYSFTPTATLELEHL